MGTVLKSVGASKRRKLVHAKRNEVLSDQFQGVEGPLDTQHLLISALLPPAVKAFMVEIEEEVRALCGDRFQRQGEYTRWGTQPGSIVLGNQQVAIEKPRVRSPQGEVVLQTYQEFQDPKLFDQAVFTEGLKKVSQRDYEKGISKIANSFGLKKSSISKRWIKATAKKIEELQKRDLHPMDIKIVFLDGKRFRKYGVIVALGVGSGGKKHVLGIYQAESEHHESCLNLLNDLESRGVPSAGLIFVVDGGSGLNKALNIKYHCDKPSRRAIRIRCYIHKWRNIEAALGDESHKASGLFWAIRDAKDMAEAKVLSERLESVLKQTNLSAYQSYLEAKADLLAVHEFKLSKNLKRFLSSTNAIESLNSLIEEDMRRVKNWKSSEHFQRWLATYCLNSEKRMRKIRGYHALPGLWVNLRNLLQREESIDMAEASA